MPISGTGLSLLYHGFSDAPVDKTGYEMVCTFNKDEIKKLIQITNEHSEDIVYYKDYWRMAKVLDALPYGKIPKDIKEAHDYICEIYEYHKDKMLSEAFHRSVTRPEYLLFDSTAELDKDNKIHYKKNENEYRIIVPKVQRDLTKESENLNHCVRTYIGAVAKCDTFILFLRKSDNLTKSFATIEVTKDMRLIQLKAINNTTAPKDAQDFVKQWAKEKHIRIDSCDIK